MRAFCAASARGGSKPPLVLCRITETQLAPPPPPPRPPPPGREKKAWPLTVSSDLETRVKNHGGRGSQGLHDSECGGG